MKEKECDRGRTEKKRERVSERQRERDIERVLLRRKDGVWKNVWFKDRKTEKECECERKT